MMRAFPHVYPDTRSLVLHLEALTFTAAEQGLLWLITDDVEGLYVNIPQDKPLAMLDAHLTATMHRGADDGRAALRAQWLTKTMNIVFLHMHLRFGDTVFHQECGLPMGSPVSADVASCNAYVSTAEDLPGVREHPGDALAAHLPAAKCLKLFRRLIDDYIIISAGLDALQVHKFLNEVDRRLAQAGLKVTRVVQTQSMDTLDLHVYRPQDMHSTGKHALRTHAKLGVTQGKRRGTSKDHWLDMASCNRPHCYRCSISPSCAALHEKRTCMHAVSTLFLEQDSCKTARDHSRPRARLELDNNISRWALRFSSPLCVCLSGLQPHAPRACIHSGPGAPGCV